MHRSIEKYCEAPQALRSQGQREHTMGITFPYNFEWSFGYRPTFGLIAVNRQTQERTIKPSARWLGHTARAHGF
jgi:hypothetical protein